MHHVIQIARAQALGERADFLGKDFFERIAKRCDAVLRAVRVRMMYRTANRFQDQYLVMCQIELHARRVADTAQRPAIANAPLR